MENMENTLNTEQELSAHHENSQKVPPGQSPEPELAKEGPAEADPLKKLQDELAEAKDKYVRLYAEFENHRRRTAKEKQDLIFGANEQLLRSLLPVMDDFERAEKAFQDRNTKEAEGYQLIHNKYRKILEQNGVKAMEITSETVFNADLHEAITQVPASDESKKGKIVEVVEKGYLLNDKVIRFAKVVVGS
jgi:molecular chaperone GrpE